MKNNIANYMNYLGHVLENKDLHVCGYEGMIILVQNVEGRVIRKPRRYGLNKNSKGIYFNFRGKRIYVAVVNY